MRFVVSLFLFNVERILNESNDAKYNDRWSVCDLKKVETLCFIFQHNLSSLRSAVGSPVRIKNTEPAHCPLTPPHRHDAVTLADVSTKSRTIVNTKSVRDAIRVSERDTTYHYV